MIRKRIRPVTDKNVVLARFILATAAWNRLYFEISLVIYLFSGLVMLWQERNNGSV